MESTFCDTRHNQAVSVQFFLYQDGLPGISLVIPETGEPWMMASFHPGADYIAIAREEGAAIDEETIFIKTWSEGAGIEKVLSRAGIICADKPTVKIEAGYVNYHGFRLTDAAMTVINGLRQEMQMSQQKQTASDAFGLHVQQNQLADDAFASYNFGDGLTVVGSSGWQIETFDGKDDWTKVVYVECDDDEPNADSHKVSFHAAFARGTAILNEAYAYWCENGAEIGSPGNTKNDETIKSARMSPK